MKDRKNYVFNIDSVKRIPYMAPGLVTKEKAARGKTPTDTWWHTVVGTSPQRTGYPTQKPEGVLKRIIQSSSKEGDLILDPFAGSGTTGKVCLDENRRFVMIDNNQEAIDTMKERFSADKSIKWDKIK